jgi:NAD(P)H-nitrite reductase large subunit
VVLDDDRRLACDLVVIAIGVKPRMELMAGQDIKQNRGLIVDRFMATSKPDVYACGDVAEAYEYLCGENRLTPIWPTAYMGGWVAGSNMAGGKVEYPGGTAMNSMKYFGIDIVSAGSLIACDGCKVLQKRQGDMYKKVIIKDGLITGMAFGGDIEMAGIIYNLMKDRVDVSGFAEALTADDFGLASLPEEIWRNKLALTPCEKTEVSR